jgi:hypothetical protein
MLNSYVYPEKHKMISNIRLHLTKKFMLIKINNREYKYNTNCLLAVV